MPVFRFSNKAFHMVRSVKAFLNPEDGIPCGAAPDAEQHKDQVESPKHARRRMSEYRSEAGNDDPDDLLDFRQKIKERDPPLERIATAQLRQLPDFIIIGTQRGGTTSLYRYLAAHPDIGPALRKEVHFFDRYYDKGMNWYLANFPVRGEASVVGEASPYYLFHPDVPERARRAVPHAKFIALLRNPVDRAYSHYQMKVRRGVESLSFEDAIDKEPERLSRSDDPASLTWRYFSYLKRGVYVDQLKRWMSVFPREQFLIIKSEDFYKDPERVLHQTLKYLGLRPWSPSNLKAYHLSEYTGMDPATRKRLREYFAPYNQQLYTFLGRDLGWEYE